MQRYQPLLDSIDGTTLLNLSKEMSWAKFSNLQGFTALVQTRCFSYYSATDQASETPRL